MLLLSFSRSHCLQRNPKRPEHARYEAETAAAELHVISARLRAQAPSGTFTTSANQCSSPGALQQRHPQDGFGARGPKCYFGMDVL